MKLTALARLSTCSLLLGLCPALLSHCGGAANDREPGTETGNPPVVDTQKLRLVTNAAGAELIAQPGAVPGGAEVRLENRGTGESAETTASADGSFRVLVPGAALDTYEVTVTYRGGTVTVPVSVDLNPISTDPSMLSCEQLESSLQERLDLAFTPATRGCTTDSECVIRGWDSDCYYGCGYSYVLSSQADAASAAAEQSSAPICRELEERACDRSAPPSCPAPDLESECYQGTCRALSVAGLTCIGVSQRAATRMSEAASAASLHACTSDLDCTLITYSLSCVATCGGGILAAIATTASSRFDEILSSIEGRICGEFSANGCSVLPPSCPLLPDTSDLPAARAVCRDNLCQTEYGPETP
jgi:hypothetical protein